MRIEPMIAATRADGHLRRLAGIVLGLMLVVSTGPAAAQDPNAQFDGLNSEMRAALYNSGTSLVARLDLTQLGHDQMVQTVHGLFDPDAYASFLGNTKDFDAQLEQYLAPTKASAALVALDYKTLTVVVLQGALPFAALRLGDKVDDTMFAAAQIGIQGALSLIELPAVVTRLGDYALIGKTGAALPTLPHTQSIEDTILLGLQQPSGTPAIVFVLPVDDALRAQLAAGGATAPDFATAIGQADYIGGYLVTGPDPQLHLYVRYGSDATAENVKALYDKAWAQQITQADTEDANNAASNVKQVSYISSGEMVRRVQAAMRVTLFNGIVKLDLDTLALRQITGAIVDRYYRMPPDSTPTPPPDTNAPADNGSPAPSAETAQ